jgi:pimeloyl-ACP methyl ester carboxylesterase
MKKKFVRRILWSVLIVFILMNVIAFFHAYKFTHFVSSAESSKKTADPKALNTTQKLKAMFLGVENPRPSNYEFPDESFEVIRLKSNKEIECWSIQRDSSNGTVVLFHGYGGSKSSLLERSKIFLSQNYSVLLVDFMGSGGSEGNTTTIGYYEAKDVQRCFEYLKERGEEKVFLFGTSMGAVAIMRSISKFDISPTGIILECPFGSMYKTVSARFRNMNAPVFPMAGLLVFWGGVQHGYWAFGHNPVTYAKNIRTPVLLMYGEKDDKVSEVEIESIFSNLKGPKKRIDFPDAGHEDYLNKYGKQWTEEAIAFLKQSTPGK